MKKKTIKRINDAARIVFSILTAIILIYTIYLILLKLSGNSPDIVTIIGWAVGGLISLQILILTILFQIQSNIGELNEFKRNVIMNLRNLNQKVFKRSSDL